MNVTTKIKLSFKSKEVVLINTLRICLCLVAWESSVSSEEEHCNYLFDFYSDFISELKLLEERHLDV